MTPDRIRDVRHVDVKGFASPRINNRFGRRPDWSFAFLVITEVEIGVLAVYTLYGYSKVRKELSLETENSLPGLGRTKIRIHGVVAYS